MAINILSVSDIETGFIHSPQIREYFSDVDLVISCGDMHYSYLEYIVSMLNRPLYFVHGNHGGPEYSLDGVRTQPGGGINLHRDCIRDQSGLLLSGVEGCNRYNKGPNQYNQAEMWGNVFNLVPHLMFNRLRYGRYLDVFVSHAPPWGIQDAGDLPHQGIKAFCWLIRVFKPAVHLHGHTHVYRNDAITSTLEKQTRVINSYGYRRLQFTLADGLAQAALLH